jgi:putative membrane protein
MLSAIDRDRIEAAIAAAEQGSSGEIVCTLAGEVSSYREVPLVMATFVSLVLTPLALAVGYLPLAHLVSGSLWMPAQASALEGEIALAVGAYATLQAALFGAAFLIASLPPVRRRLTPRSLKAHRVLKVAQQQFAAVSSRAVGSDTGVLIFVALDDHRVEILADAAIHQKCGKATWDDATGAVRGGMKAADPTDGIVRAIEICGAALRQHFPLEGTAVNALSNRPLEI